MYPLNCSVYVEKASGETENFPMYHAATTKYVSLLCDIYIYLCFGK